MPRSKIVGRSPELQKTKEFIINGRATASNGKTHLVMTGVSGAKGRSERAMAVSVRRPPLHPTGADAYVACLSTYVILSRRFFLDTSMRLLESTSQITT